MITLTNTAFGYDRRQKVFSGLSLAFGEGHIHGVLGCNGIGKTTLLHLICGLLTPTQAPSRSTASSPQAALPGSSRR